MSAMSAPRPVIDNLEFAQSGGHLRGAVEIAALERLHEYLNSRSGQLEWQLDGVADQAGKPALRIAVKGVLDLICQRCLDGYAFDINSNSVLLLESEDSGVLDDDAVESIPISSDFAVEALVEDEVILALPMSPRHPEGKCAARVATGLDDNVHPFAALAKLKKV